MYYKPKIFRSFLERLVERIFMQVSVSRREAELEMDNKDFDERKHNYRRKKWIEDGLDPDEMEDKYTTKCNLYLKSQY